MNGHRMIVIVLLAACAPAPASLPTIRIDRTLQGAVVSREAAETIAVLRERERASWQLQIEDEKERADVADAKRKTAEWWKDFGPPAIAGGTILGIIMGVVLGSQVRLR